MRKKTIFLIFYLLLNKLFIIKTKKHISVFSMNSQEKFSSLWWKQSLWILGTSAFLQPLRDHLPQPPINNHFQPWLSARGHFFHLRAGTLLISWLSFQGLICARIEDDELTSKNPKLIGYLSILCSLSQIIFFLIQRSFSFHLNASETLFR